MIGRKRAIFLLLGILILFFLLSEFFLPGFAADILQDIFIQETDSIGKLNIEINTFPAIKMLLGRIDSVEVEAEGLLLKNLYLDSLKLSYEEIIFHKGGFSGINTRLESIITEESLNNYISEAFPDLKDFNLTINPNQVFLQGNISFLEMIFNIQLSGNFVINDKKDIYFIPDNLKVENLNIPVDLLKTYIEGLDFSFNLKELDIPLDVSEIQLGSTYVLISGGENQKGRDINE